MTVIKIKDVAKAHWFHLATAERTLEQAAAWLAENRSWETWTIEDVQRVQQWSDTMEKLQEIGVESMQRQVSRLKPEYTHSDVGDAMEDSTSDARWARNRKSIASAFDALITPLSSVRKVTR